MTERNLNRKNLLSLGLFAVLFVCCVISLHQRASSVHLRREASYILQRGLHSRIFNLRSAVPFTHRQPFANKNRC